MNNPNEILIPAETFESLAVAIAQHIEDCSRDHRATFHQTPLVEFNAALSTLRCPLCNTVESLDKPPADGTQMSTYICHLLRQQQRFYETHFATCVKVN